MRTMWGRKRIREALQRQGKLREMGAGTSSTGTHGVAGVTTGANVGAYEVPLGSPLKRKIPVGDEEETLTFEPVEHVVSKVRRLIGS